IAANTTSIQANTGKIAANEGKIAANTTSIQAKANAADLKAANERITTIADQYNTLNTSVDTVSNNYKNLDTKVGKMDKGLSAGIASAVALGMMPAPAAGSQYITGGTGFYNGQSAVAVGLTGATESGKVTYKLGGSLTSSGASTFGAGAGYRWK
ncbi:YadA C-terminal domain-containing protein, partial [Moraxella sp. 7624LN]